MGFHVFRILFRLLPNAKVGCVLFTLALTLQCESASAKTFRFEKDEVLAISGKEKLKLNEKARKSSPNLIKVRNLAESWIQNKIQENANAFCTRQICPPLNEKCEFSKNFETKSGSAHSSTKDDLAEKDIHKHEFPSDSPKQSPKMGSRSAFQSFSRDYFFTSIECSSSNLQNHLKYDLSKLNQFMTISTAKQPPCDSSESDTQSEESPSQSRSSSPELERDSPVKTADTEKKCNPFASLSISKKHLQDLAHLPKQAMKQEENPSLPELLESVFNHKINEFLKQDPAKLVSQTLLYPSNRKGAVHQPGGENAIRVELPRKLFPTVQDVRAQEENALYSESELSQFVGNKLAWGRDLLGILGTALYEKAADPLISRLPASVAKKVHSAAAIASKHTLKSGYSEAEIDLKDVAIQSAKLNRPVRVKPLGDGKFEVTLEISELTAQLGLEGRWSGEKESKKRPFLDIKKAQVSFESPQDPIRIQLTARVGKNGQAIELLPIQNPNEAVKLPIAHFKFGYGNSAPGEYIQGKTPEQQPYFDDLTEQQRNERVAANFGGHTEEERLNHSKNFTWLADVLNNPQVGGVVPLVKVLSVFLKTTIHTAIAEKLSEKANTYTQQIGSYLGQSQTLSLNMGLLASLSGMTPLSTQKGGQSIADKHEEFLQDEQLRKMAGIGDTDEFSPMIDLARRNKLLGPSVVRTRLARKILELRRLIETERIYARKKQGRLLKQIEGLEKLSLHSGSVSQKQLNDLRNQLDVLNENAKDKDLALLATLLSERLKLEPKNRFLAQAVDLTKKEILLSAQMKESSASGTTRLNQVDLLQTTTKAARYAREAFIAQQVLQEKQEIQAKTELAARTPLSYEQKKRQAQYVSAKEKTSLAQATFKNKRALASLAFEALKNTEKAQQKNTPTSEIEDARKSKLSSETALNNKEISVAVDQLILGENRVTDPSNHLRMQYHFQDYDDHVTLRLSEGDGMGEECVWPQDNHSLPLHEELDGCIGIHSDGLNAALTQASQGGLLTTCMAMIPPSTLVPCDDPSPKKIIFNLGFDGPPQIEWLQNREKEWVPYVDLSRLKVEMIAAKEETPVTRITHSLLESVKRVVQPRLRGKMTFGMQTCEDHQPCMHAQYLGLEKSDSVLETAFKKKLSAIDSILTSGIRGTLNLMNAPLQTILQKHTLPSGGYHFGYKTLEGQMLVCLKEGEVKKEDREAKKAEAR